MKTLKEKMIYLGYSSKKQITILVLVNVIFVLGGAAIFYFLKDMLYTLMILGAITVFNILFLSRYSKKISAKTQENLQDFAVIFGFFRIYIHNGNSVYTSLKEILKFANEDLKRLLDTLINAIDNDKSVQPFVEFSKNFNEIIVEEMMISIYQLIDDGGSSENLMQFELIFDKFSDTLYQKYLRNKDSKLGTICSSALLGSGFLIIVLTIGIMSVVGELISGI